MPTLKVMDPPSVPRPPAQTGPPLPVRFNVAVPSNPPVLLQDPVPEIELSVGE
jgi:hypothetical protein